MKNSTFSKNDKSKSMKELVRETTFLIDNIRLRLEKILIEQGNNEKNSLSDLTTYGFIFEIIKKLEISALLISNQYFNSFKPLAREILEVSSQLIYLLNDEDTFKVKALRYQYLEQLRRAETYKSKPNYGDFKEKILDSEMYTLGRESIDKQNLPLHKLKWYNLNGKINNLKKLFFEVNLDSHYEVVYKDFSIQTHGLDAVKSSFYSSEASLFFSNIKALRDPHFPIFIDTIVHVCLEVIESIRKFYGFENDNEYIHWKGKYIISKNQDTHYFKLSRKWDEFSFEDSFNKGKLNIEVKGNTFNYKSEE